jgi:FemAB-related protein (PEP-CTERM system-associated)
MHLPLGENMWERLDKKVRNQIRKAQKSDLSAERGQSALIAEFYQVFARNMRDLGTPVYSRRLFEQVLETFPERAALHVVRLNRQPVAAGLTFRTGDTVEVPWASSIRDYNHLCPNHLLYWHIIESAVAAGCGLLDFGRSTPGEGTFKFKEQWGAQPVALHWEYPWLTRTLPDNSPKNARFQAAIELWKRLPLTVATALGPRIVRGIP